jgi:hypothetical protein
MKTLLLTMAMFLTFAAQASTKDYIINLNRTVWGGSTTDLIWEIEDQDSRFRAKDYKILRVAIKGQSKRGRYGDFRRPTAGAYLKVKGNGGCNENEVKFKRREFSEIYINNPNGGSISDGDWIVGFCDDVKVEYIKVTVERRRQRGGNNGGGNNGGGRPNAPKHPGFFAKAGWSPIVTYRELDEEAHTVVIRNPARNQEKIQIKDIGVEIATRRGNDSKWLDLSDYYGTSLKPGQKLEIPMPQNRRGNDVRNILKVEIELESWKRSGEKVRINFIGKRNRRPRDN